MRITDIALSTPVTGARPPAARRPGEGAGAAPVVRPAPTERGASPDEVAEVALQKAAAFAAAARTVAAQNELASASASQERLTEALVP